MEWEDLGVSQRCFPLGLARVKGRSMLPTLHPGDLLLIRYGGRSSRVGELVVAAFPDGTVAVKRVAEVRRAEADEKSAFWLLSDNPAEGVDSRHRGAVPERAVIARVVRRLRRSKSS